MITLVFSPWIIPAAFTILILAVAWLAIRETIRIEGSFSLAAYLLAFAALAGSGWVWAISFFGAWYFK